LNKYKRKVRSWFKRHTHAAKHGNTGEKIGQRLCGKKKHERWIKRKKARKLTVSEKEMSIVESAKEHRYS